ncbi:hypothetical protein [Legionella antarctica]|nr:hypothetical protein [Legionella antarctica]
MSFPKYYVTYCVMDADAGANPFGHSCLIFSQQENDTSIEVVDSVGFYSQPSTTTNPFLKGLKHVLGFNVDLQDGHGILKQEAMRNLDGDGLRGISFAVTPEQFAQTLQDYHQMMKTQEDVISELNLELTLKGIEPNGHTRYIAEKAKAAAEGRMPRLKPFHFTMKLTMNGLDSSDSYTCKDNSLEVLTRNHIIPEKIRNQLISNRATTAFPRFSSLSLPPIRLISTGEPQKTISRSTGNVYFNREWGTNSLFWGSSIQVTEQEALDEKRTDDTYDLVAEVMHRIRDMEYLLRHRIEEVEVEPELKEEHLSQLNVQLKRVQNLRYLFAYKNENQTYGSFNGQLLKADQVLNAAHISMNPDKINYSFLLKAYESILFHDAMMGLLVMAISASAALFLASPLGVGLFMVSTGFTALKLYGFYKEEVKFAQACKDYAMQDPNEEFPFVPSVDPA